MPKLIENLRERILADARQTLTDEGYRALSMRGLARRAGVAPGTLYNYFSSKDELVATIALADWRQVTSRMECAAIEAPSLPEGLAALLAALDSFSGRYRSTWEQYDGAGAAGYAARYHRTLRDQVAAPVRTLARRLGRTDVADVADVLAEALLACSVSADLGTDQLVKLASILDAARPEQEDPA